MRRKYIKLNVLNTRVFNKRFSLSIKSVFTHWRFINRRVFLTTVFRAVTLSHACDDYFYIRDVIVISHGNGEKTATILLHETVASSRKVKSRRVGCVAIASVWLARKDTTVSWPRGMVRLEQTFVGDTNTYSFHCFTQEDADTRENYFLISSFHSPELIFAKTTYQVIDEANPLH